jgi:hypothetical protein
LWRPSFAERSFKPSNGLTVRTSATNPEIPRLPSKNLGPDLARFTDCANVAGR